MDYRAIATGVKMVPVGDYSEVQRKLREKYEVYESMVVYINYDNPNIERGTKTIKCVVISVDEWHITLEFPKGYRQSFSWSDFKAMRTESPWSRRR